MLLRYALATYLVFTFLAKFKTPTLSSTDDLGEEIIAISLEFKVESFEFKSENASSFSVDLCLYTSLI